MVLVRRLDKMTEPSPLALKVPFLLEGAENVLVDTIKRGEDGGKTVILRMHEHLGGWARPTLMMYVSRQT